MKSNKYSSTYISILYSSHIINFIIQSYCCAYSITPIRIISKIFIMPLLFLIYISLTDKKKRSKLLMYGIIFGWFGDIFMLAPSSSPLIICGILSFLIGHLCYIIKTMKNSSMKVYQKNIHYIFLVLILYSYISFFILNYVKEGFIKGKILIPGIIYLAIIGIFNASSLFNLITNFNISNFQICIGSMLFWTSDFILIRMMFYELLYYYHFIVMTTYMLAQTLIVIGMSGAEKNTLNEVSN